MANRSDDDVSVINLATNKKIGPDIPVGIGPWGIAITPDGARAYVVNNHDDDLSVINLATNKKIGLDIPVGASPIAIAINPV